MAVGWLREHGGDVLVGVAGVDHGRACRPRVASASWRSKTSRWTVARGVVVVVVQPHLAGRDDPRVAPAPRRARPPSRRSRSRRRAGGPRRWRRAWARRPTSSQRPRRGRPADSPITTTCATPAAQARASTSATSAANAPTPRWQWVSTSMRSTGQTRLGRPAVDRGCPFAPTGSPRGPRPERVFTPRASAPGPLAARWHISTGAAM